MPGRDEEKVAHRASHSATSFCESARASGSLPTWPCSGCAGIGAAGDRMHRQIGAIEIMVGAGIDHDARQRAAAARAVDHLPAGRRRGDVVLAADQEQGRHPRAPAEAGGDAAVRIERDRRAEIGLGAARRQLRAHRPEHRARAMRPADQADAIVRRPCLLRQPLPRRRDVLDPLAPRAHLALA